MSLTDSSLNTIVAIIENGALQLAAEVKRLRDLYEPPKLKIAIPTYFYPGALWTSLDSNTSIAVINPNSGPGTQLNPDYVSTVKAAQAKGITVLGYVTSSYAKKDQNTFMIEVKDYEDWYGVDGIFIDECSTDPAQAPWYNTMNNFIKNSTLNKGLTVINPGTLIPEAYVNCADIILNFESDALTYMNFKLAGWEIKYPASKFWHLIHTCTAAQLPAVMAKVKTLNTGYVYATPDTLPNPWDTLPYSIFWQTELGLR